MKRTIGSALVAFAFAVSATSLASAADFGGRFERSFKDDPIPPAAFSWTGFYFGGHLGYGSGDSTTSGESPGAFDGNPDAVSTDPDGIFGGVQLGYNYQSGSFVVGIEADVGYLGIDDAAEVDDEGFADHEYGAYGVLALRLGIASNRALFYAKGGLALAEIDTKAGDLLAAGGPDESDLTSFDETYVGYAIGGGIEYAVTDRWTLKAEYLYMDFGSEDSTNDDGNDFSTDHELHTAKVGLNYKF
ncbi:MAG: outer membrane protein [Pseudomonadota bacterium]